MSLGSFFKKAGVDIEKVLEVGDAAAQVAEPVVDILFPAVGTLYNTAVNEAAKLLAAGSQAASQGGSAGVQLANVVAVVEPLLVAYAQQEGLPAPTAAQINAYTQLVLLSLQVLNSIETGSEPPAVASSSAAVQAASAQPAAAAAPAGTTQMPGGQTVLMPGTQLGNAGTAAVIAGQANAGPGLHTVVAG